MFSILFESDLSFSVFMLLNFGKFEKKTNYCTVQIFVV